MLKLSWAGQPSAAARFAVSGARAADAVVVAEPEPAEYVEICDVYGAGYYYIPGTETCLSIRGLVRYQISFDDRDDGWRKNAYARLDINAKSETECGTLTGYIRFAATSADVSPLHTNGLGKDPTDGGVGTPSVYMEYVTISLGGLSMGLSDSLYDVDVGAEFDTSGGPRVHFINYTFDAGNGFSATLALEEENNNIDYVPNLVGRIGVSQGWGTADLYVTYNDDDDGDWADDATHTVVASAPAPILQTAKEWPMYLHDDTDMATVVTTTAKAILEGARHISRADRAISKEQIGQLETAVKELQRAIDAARLEGEQA